MLKLAKLDENKFVDATCNGECMKELEKLRIENEIFKSRLEDANKTIAKFVEGKTNLNIFLSQQKLILDKGGI